MTDTNYAILRFQKLKSLSKNNKFKKADSSKTKIKHALSHNLRSYAVLNANDDKKHQNKIIIGSNNVEDCIKEIDQYTNENVKNFRSDNVFAIEAIQTFSEQKNINLDEWVKANVDFLNNKFGAENVKSVVLHNDEKTPHLHAIIIPIKNGKLNCKSFIGSTKQLVKLQDEYADLMKQFELERGIKKEKDSKKIKHKDLKIFYTQQQKFIKNYRKNNKLKLNFKDFKVKKTDELNKKMFESKQDYLERINTLIREEVEHYANEKLKIIMNNINITIQKNEDEKKQIQLEKDKITQEKIKIKEQKEQIKQTMNDKINEAIIQTKRELTRQFEDKLKEKDNIIKQNKTKIWQLELDKDEMKDELKMLRSISVDVINEYLYQNNFIKFKNERKNKKESTFDYIKRVCNVDFYNAEKILIDIYHQKDEKQELKKELNSNLQR